MTNLILTIVVAVGLTVLPSWGSPGPLPEPCHVQSVAFEGWNAVEISNDWVRLEIVPQLGGRLMQVTFGDHHYLFVNREYEGKYFSPQEAGQWFNYGGDKVWPLPEGHGAGEWPGPISDALDDGEYKSTIVSRDRECKVHLESPPDPATGLQYSRDISMSNESPQISFHAVMKNVTDHPIRWSMQSVTQYDTADGRDSGKYNHDFWAFAPINRRSVYMNGYWVRAGLADDPSFAVDNGLFKLHWLYLENEVWLDSDGGWVAVVDDAVRYGLIERFQYTAEADYPGKASVIFYKNGAALTLDESGMPLLRSANPQQAPYYMEAEINSPMIKLEPGASYALDTSWFPTRTSKELKTVTSAGVVEHPLAATLTRDSVQISGTLGVFFPGKLVAHVLDGLGAQISVLELTAVDPLTVVELNQAIKIAERAASVAIHLTDRQGMDRGTLGEAKISK